MVRQSVGRAAVVGNAQGEILLTQRADSGWWLYPVGWADVGYSASEVAVMQHGFQPFVPGAANQAHILPQERPFLPFDRPSRCPFPAIG